MNLRLSALFVALGILIFQSCVNHELGEIELAGCAKLISFQADVKPIISTSCAKSGCHNGDLGDDKNWTIFERFQGKSATVKVRIKRALGEPGHMPADGELPVDDINTIVCWVDQGSQNN